jgi:putative exosortase-associated protein (TIGR04073 family)
MNKFTQLALCSILASLIAACSPAANADEALSQQGYASKVGHKAARSFANLLTAPLEIPKNVINVTNQSNVFYGILGGGFKGIVHTAGRLGVAIADLISIPLPTKPIAHPIYVWEDFDIDTTYGDTFRYDPSQELAEPQPPAPEPAAQPASPVIAEPAPAVDYSNQYQDPDTNKKLDTIFKKEMMK